MCCVWVLYKCLFNPHKGTICNSMQCLLVCSVWMQSSPESLAWQCMHVKAPNAVPVPGRSMHPPLLFMYFFSTPSLWHLWPLPLPGRSLKCFQVLHLTLLQRKSSRLGQSVPLVLIFGLIPWGLATQGHGVPHVRRTEEVAGWDRPNKTHTCGIYISWPFLHTLLSPIHLPPPLYSAFGKRRAWTPVG